MEYVPVNEQCSGTGSGKKVARNNDLNASRNLSNFLFDRRPSRISPVSVAGRVRNLAGVGAASFQSQQERLALAGRVRRRIQKELKG